MPDCDLTEVPCRPAGKWNKHVDAWDAVQNNEFFSPEAWIFAFGQMFQARHACSSFTSTATHQRRRLCSRLCRGAGVLRFSI